MATTGEIFPTSVKTSAVSAGDLDWSSAAQILTNDGAGANITVATFDLNIQSYRLKAKGFVFPAGLSAGATINGVIARIEGWNNTSVMLVSVNLLDNVGGVAGTNKEGLSNSFSTVTTIVSMGASTDKWGNDHTPSWVGSSAFGLGLRLNATSNNCDTWIDYVTLEIIYDLSSEANATNVKFVEC
jgi:hypothetical protein